MIFLSRIIFIPLHLNPLPAGERRAKDEFPFNFH
jgi:hypothetical protein